MCLSTVGLIVSMFELDRIYNFELLNLMSLLFELSNIKFWFSNYFERFDSHF